ncbi:Calcium-transporting P-type ATPase, N-terminal autoinhibitory domain [Dillenia turbinata]|uniref:Calcium-transporting ATPase n=1 Tax=Dillenia turbinata TaxID=194707 RepID=A0AAN8WES8_9MAGN
MANEKDSPLRRNNLDIEAGESGGDDVDNTNPFDITTTKNAPIERLKRWRRAALVLNASRRFRYTLDLKKEEEKAQIRRKMRAHAQVLRAAILFKEAPSKENGVPKLPEAPTGDFGITPDQLLSLTRDHDLNALRQYDGAKKGIPGNDEDILKLKTAFGSNTYPRKKPRSFWVFLWEAWQDLTLIILMVAAVASLALGIKTEGIKEGWYDGASIAFAVILVIVVTGLGLADCSCLAISDYRQSLQFQNLNEEKRNIHLEVVRGGRRVPVSIFDIVVGDVVPLKIGDQVPADGILISGHSLAIDESSMTGESKIVHKDAKAPFLMSGCKVADGFGTMLVTSVGINTEWGLLMASISEDTGEETPLQVRLNGVATFIGIVGLSVAFVVLVVLLIRFFTGNTTNPDGSVQFKAGQTKVGTAIDGVIKIITVAVTIVVVAVPEGLPLAVTLTLAYSMRKMMRDKALVRRLSACETMGSATTICSDKTGTLTINQMTVVEAYVSGKKMDPPDDMSLISPMASGLLIEGIAQNSTGSVFVPEAGGAEEVTGSPTEKAILNWGLKLGMNFEATRSGSSVLHVFPFNSEKKRGGVALKLPDSQVHIHWKGAAELVLASCGSYIDENNSVLQMDEQKMNFFKKVIEDMAAGSLRCVAIAFRDYEAEKVPTDEELLSQWALPEDQLVLLAIVGLKDPCRPEVKVSMQLCRTAGVKVRMVTGDNLQTAKAIALECGILGSGDDAVEPNLIEGKTFRALTDVQRLEIAEKISVMGRSSPNDKLLLVQALKKNGHVVAVTGDGTNDAPALHEADIGLAMGIQGTEVAKESSDIIILDDNFSSVVKVVRWGRSVYANIQKFIQFQLTVNVAALIINVVAAVSSGDVPLNAVQLLWVNLIMDTLGALALATEPPTDHLMHRPPVGRR